jgi:hypothetical protein
MSLIVDTPIFAEAAFTSTVNPANQRYFDKSMTCNDWIDSG